MSITSWTMLLSGTVAIAVSLYYTSNTLAFIGLGLSFWGAILNYVRTEEYCKRSLLDAVVTPAYNMLNQMITDLAFEGSPIYLPPRYFSRSDTMRVYISKDRDERIPSVEYISKNEGRTLMGKEDGLLVYPIGEDLTRLFENLAGVDFIRLDIQQFQERLEKLLTDDLEIAEGIQTRYDGNIFYLDARKPIIGVLHREEKETETRRFLDPPLISAVACSLAKVTGEPIVVGNIQTSVDDLKAEFHVLSKE